ncbi:MAG: pyridoxal-phosphate dependent enzyme [Acidimicrobiia bacterium]|nr:pyridoxal-phosphate dependent enzyme [Acidimicrobiia bacterium]
MNITALRDAHERIRPHIHRTPVLTSATFDRETGIEAFFKAEHLQKIGAFKARGALNAILRLEADTAARGVVTHSSGNHGAAVAWAAARRGIPATVVMPHGASRVKVDAVESHGARVVRCAHGEREATAEAEVASTGGTLIHPYEHPDVIAGQGTATIELLEDVGPLDALVVPVGGGGLSSGSAIALAALAPATSLVGAEPARADDAYESLGSGRLVPGRTDPDTIADGLRAGLGPTTFEILRSAGPQIVRVEDADIVEACRFHLLFMKQVVEPSGAVATAALRSIAARMPGARVGVVLSGGNTDLGWL